MAGFIFSFSLKELFVTHVSVYLDFLGFCGIGLCFIKIVLSQRLGLGKGGLRMAPEEALQEILQVCIPSTDFLYKIPFIIYFLWHLILIKLIACYNSC